MGENTDHDAACRSHRDGAIVCFDRILPCRHRKRIVYLGVQMVGRGARLYHDVRALFPCGKLRAEIQAEDKEDLPFFFGRIEYPLTGDFDTARDYLITGEAQKGNV